MSNETDQNPRRENDESTLSEHDQEPSKKGTRWAIPDIGPRRPRARWFIPALLLALIIGGGLGLIQRDHATAASTKPSAEALALRAQQHELATSARVRALESVPLNVHGDIDQEDERANVTLRVQNVIDTKNLGPLAKMSDTQLRQYSKDLVDTQNKILHDSGVYLRFQLVDTILERDYVASKSGANAVLGDWFDHPESRKTSHEARVRNNADVVVILDGSFTDACGLAHNANTGFHASDAVALVAAGCQDSPFTDLTYAHEVGHTLGLNHDRATTGPSGVKADPFSNNYGYADAKNHVHDIMAYEDHCKTKDQSCTEIPQYSSSHIEVPMAVMVGEHVQRTYTVPLGDAKNDSVRFMNSHLTYYAAMNFNAGN